MIARFSASMTGKVKRAAQMLIDTPEVVEASRTTG
jgi:hypothetical protein